MNASAGQGQGPGQYKDQDPGQYKDQDHTMISVSPITKVLVSAFAIFYFGLFPIWWLPPFALRDKLIYRVTPPLMYMGIWQDYGVFIPNPRARNFHIDAIVLMADGSIAVWPYPRIEQLGVFERSQKERYRKFGYDHLAFEHDSAMWPDVCRYIARQYAPAHPVSVMLRRHFADIPDPKDGSRDILPEHSQSMVYYIYPVTTADMETK